MAKKKKVSKKVKTKALAKKTKTIPKKVEKAKKKTSIDLADLSDKLYRYDNEEKMDEFFNKLHPQENFEEPDFEDEEEEEEYRDENLSPESRRADAVYDEYLELIEEILEDPKMELHQELKSLSEEEMDTLRDNLYTEIDAGVT